MSAQNKINSLFSKNIPHRNSSDYLELRKASTPLLNDVLYPLLNQEGSLSFQRYMELCLYHPLHGYYTNPQFIRTGTQGDFFTSVSVGACFGHLLAYYIHDLWIHSCQPDEPYCICEWGAEDGALANDILMAIRDQFPSLYRNLSYHIIEPFPTKQAFQQNTLSDHPLVQIHTSPQSIPSTKGITIANELLDALPVHLIQKEQNTWNELHVCLDPDHPPALSFTSKTLSSSLQTLLKTIPPSLPDAYQTELVPHYTEILNELISPLQSGHLLLMDYGHETSRYYQPTRTNGTLRSYYQHHALDDPLLLPGQQDLSAHVHFSQLIEDAHQLRPRPIQIFDYKDQASFLVSILKKNPTCLPTQYISQFQTLTHPALMGQSFHALAFKVPLQEKT